MKKIKEDKPRQKQEHKIETPSPPQVMDPSSPPDEQSGDKPKNTEKQNRKGEHSGKEKQALAPREEL